MTRTNLRDVEGLASVVTRMLHDRGADALVQPESRCGYRALDLYDRDGRCLRTLTTGTTGELERYLRGMCEALWLLEPPYRASGVGAADGSQEPAREPA